MVCPGCSSVIPQVDSELVAEVEDVKQYEHECSRCHTIIKVTILIVKRGPEKLIKGWKEWVTKGINFDVVEASKS